MEESSHFIHVYRWHRSVTMETASYVQYLYCPDNTKVTTVLLTCPSRVDVYFIFMSMQFSRKTASLRRKGWLIFCSELLVLVLFSEIFVSREIFILTNLITPRSPEESYRPTEKITFKIIAINILSNFTPLISIHAIIIRVNKRTVQRLTFNV